MKLFSWAQRKLLPNHSHDKNKRNAGRLFDISPPNLACNEQGVQARASRDTHAEVLTIGTLGMGSLLSINNDREEEHDEEDKQAELEDEDVEERHIEMAHTTVGSNADPPSPNRESMSSNRESVSSNRESVSSVDIQKLQEELQKILYFKVGQGQASKSDDAKAREGGKAKAKKQKGGSSYSSFYINDKARQSNADGRAHVPSEKGSIRGVCPLQNYLEMPMEHTMTTSSGGPPYNKNVLNKKQYWLLMHNLKSKLLHYTSPTRVEMPPSLFEKLVQPKVLQHHGSTMDKMLDLLHKVMNKRPNGRWRRKRQDEGIEEEKHRCENVEEEEENLKWAVARSCRGSDRFINYITSTLAHVDKHNISIVHDQHQLHHYQYQYHCDEGAHLQLMLATSASLTNECWIKTDDEYLVLEL